MILKFLHWMNSYHPAQLSWHSNQSTWLGWWILIHHRQSFGSIVHYILVLHLILFHPLSWLMRALWNPRRYKENHGKIIIIVPIFRIMNKIILLNYITLQSILYFLSIFDQTQCCIKHSYRCVLFSILTWYLSLSF